MPTIGPVQGVVAVARQYNVGCVDIAAEELDAIVQVVVHLHEVNHGARADTLEGDTVQLVLGINIGTRIAHNDILQDTRIVVGVVAAEDARVCFTFFGAFGGAANGAFRAIVDRCKAIDHQTAPEAAGVIFHRACYRLVCSKVDWLLRGTFGKDLTALLDDNKVFVGRANDGCALCNFQRAGLCLALGAEARG